MDSLSDNNLLPKAVKNHLRNVYSTIAMCMLAAAGGAFVQLFTQSAVRLGWLSWLGSVALLLLLIAIPHDSGNQTTSIIRLELLLGFSFFTGMGSGPLVNLAVSGSGQLTNSAVSFDPSIMTTAFLGNFVVFLCFSLAAIVSNYLRCLYIIGLLLSSLLWIPLLNLVHLFIPYTLVYDSYMYSGLLLMCGFFFILYHTQRIVVKRKMGDDDYKLHCVLLFTDCVDIFESLLIALTKQPRTEEETIDCSCTLEERCR